MNRLILLLIVATGFHACKSSKPAAQNSSGALQRAIVYKTKADYSNLLPVMMNSEKTEIISYPAPSDIAPKLNDRKPSVLENGYLLDNRGISPNSVFLNITLEQYAKLTNAPSLDEMQKMITEKEPFTEMYDLGERLKFSDAVKEINTIIKKGALKDYTRLK